MKMHLKRVMKAALQKLAEQMGIVDLRDRVASMQGQLAHMYRLRNEVTAVNQAMQVFLSFHYQEMLAKNRPLPKPLATEFRCFSQGGHDGLILYLFSLLGTTNKKAVEICAEYGMECNSANLILNHGWHGLLVEGDAEKVRDGIDFYKNCQDTFVHPPAFIAAWVTVANVNSLIRDHGFAGEIDLLALDIDGVDYWIWKAIDCLWPRVVVLEFNPYWGPDKSVTIPYKSDFRLDRVNRPHFHSASLPAFVKLAREKGLRLVAVERAGFDAFFVRTGVGEDVFPEISPAQVYQEHPILRDWNSAWIQADTFGPEGDWVEV